MVYSELTTFCLLVMRMTSHLSGLNFIYQSFSHCCRLSRSSWSTFTSAEELCLYRRQSSAKRCVLDLTQIGRLLIYTRNSGGPRTVPWWTPDVTGALSLSLSLWLILFSAALLCWQSPVHSIILSYHPFSCLLCFFLSFHCALFGPSYDHPN